jgi:hypothetical protein
MLRVICLGCIIAFPFCTLYTAYMMGGHSVCMASDEGHLLIAGGAFRHIWLQI